jgi:hypothetical protein
MLRKTVHIFSFFKNDLVNNLYSPNFEATGSNNTNADPFNRTSAATGWIIVGPSRISQLRSKKYSCSSNIRALFSHFPYECTVLFFLFRFFGGNSDSFFCFFDKFNRDFTYSSSTFSEDYEDRRSFRGFSFEDAKLPSVDFQRTKMRYSNYQSVPGKTTFPAGAFALLVDPHQAKTTAQSVVDRIVRDRYIDDQVLSPRD